MFSVAPRESSVEGFPIIGQTISHYQITEKLGEGGMGVVYRAEDTRLKRKVALKVIREGMLADSAARARLLREAQMASALNHPNVCTVYEVGESEGQAYISMELVEGQPLRSVIPAGGLPRDRVISYGLQIAEALAHSHDRGIVHRDLKSSNVMVTPEGRVKVLDFGLAKRPVDAPAGEEAERTATDTLTRAGVIVGTLSYVSPEALRGEPAVASTDIWSFGVLLYELATGRLPFQGESLFDLTAAVLREPAPELPEEIGAGLTAVIHRCLAKHAAQRYQRGGEVRAAIEIIGRPPVVAETEPSRPVSRRRWMWAACGALILAAATIVGILKWQGSHRYAPPSSKVPEANEYFQRAMLFLSTQQDLPRARQMLEKALDLDPRFANARAYYGFTHALLIDSGQTNDTSWLYKAEEELRRALQDDPKSARAHASLALVYFYQGRKELTALEARKAIELDPNEKDGPNFLALYYTWNGEYEESQALLKPLLDSNPMFFPARVNFGDNLRQTGDPAGSIREQQKVLEQDPKNMLAMVSLAMAYQTKGDTAGAREALARARVLEPQNYQARLLWALQLAVEGRPADAVREMDSEVLKFGELTTVVSNVAEFYAVLGDETRSLDWLDRAVRAGDERADWFQRDPLLANVQKEPRFRQIIDGIRYRREQQAKSKR